MAIAPDGSYVVVGYFSDVIDFDPSHAQDLHTARGIYDAFITKFNADDSYAWTRTLGGAAHDLVQHVAVATDGAVMASGYYSGTVDLDPGPGVRMHTSGGSSEAFLLKLGSDGSFGWVDTFVVSGDPQEAGGEGGPVAVGPDGSVYTAGFFRGNVDVDPGTAVDLRTSLNGDSDAYVVKLSAAGTLIWGKTIACPQSENANNLKVAPAGILWLGGASPARATLIPGLALTLSHPKDWTTASF